MCIRDSSHPAHVQRALAPVLRGLLPGLECRSGLLAHPLVADQVADGPDVQQEGRLAVGQP
eukprot:8008657-Alexandrium_andersonii.AAC.1